MQPFKIITLSASLLLASVATADEATIRGSLHIAIPSLTIDSISPSPIEGLYEVQIDGNILYISADGNYLVQGHLIDLTSKEDLTDAKLAKIRQAILKNLDPDQFIAFTAPEEKYKVFVFTDIDCGYCRKLHDQIDGYLQLGITVQYLFYPRAGKGSLSYNKAVAVWCAADRHAAITASKNGDDIPMKTCDNPVDAHMQLGVQFQVQGTPMIVSESGVIFPGYVPPEALAESLARIGDGS